MSCDGGLAFIPVHPKATLEEACNHLGPFFTFDAKGCDWGDDSRSDYLRENDVGHNIVVPYGTDISDECLMADEVMDFVGFLERITEKSAILAPLPRCSLANPSVACRSSQTAGGRAPGPLMTHRPW
jgi:hypothetical protein